MKIVSWHEWLDKHIPYYEAERHRNRFLDNPPQSILIINPADRATLLKSHGLNWSNWDTTHNQIVDTGYDSSPLFLERDTNGLWYWAFWNEKEALMTVIRLT